MFYKVVKVIAVILFKIFFFIKYNNKQYVGTEGISGGFILAANHISMLDPVFIACGVKRPLHYMAKIELFKSKPLAWFIRKLNAFPVDRSKADIKAVKTSLSLLKNGRILGIFPEGTRVGPKESADAKLGAVQFAFKTRCPILPAGIHSKGGKVGLFKRVTVSFGKPIYLNEIGVTDSAPESMQKASDYVMKQIRTLAGYGNE